MTDTTPKPIWFHKDAAGKPARRWPSGRPKYRGKVTWPDGKRQDIAVPEAHCYSEDRAAEYVRHVQEQVTAGGAASLAIVDAERAARPSSSTPDASWTVAQYRARFFEARRAAGRVADVESEEGRMKHLAELDGVRLGDLSSPRYRDALRRLRSAGKIAPRSIIHVHRTFALMIRHAVADGILAASPCVLLPGDLPRKADKDPTWRATARFTAEELVAIVTDERIPDDRRVFYALLFMGCTRFGEAAALRWNAYDATATPLGKLSIAASYSTKKRAEKGTKTEVPREMPVHPALAAILATWKASGFAALFGRAPEASDLIVPSREGKNRNANHMLRRFHQDLERIGLRSRRQHDARRTFISLAREGGAGDLLKWATHGPGTAIVDLYTTPSWEKLCAEVSCVRLPSPALPAPDAAPPAAPEPERTNDEGAEAVTASTPCPPVSTFPSTRGVTARIYCGADGTRTRSEEPYTPFSAVFFASDPPPADADSGSTSANSAERGSVDERVDAEGRLDVARAVALATALDAFIAGGMLDHARPVSRELLALLRAGEAGGEVISIRAKRR